MIFLNMNELSLDIKKSNFNNRFAVVFEKSKY